RPGAEGHGERTRRVLLWTGATARLWAGGTEPLAARVARTERMFASERPPPAIAAPQPAAARPRRYVLPPAGLATPRGLAPLTTPDADPPSRPAPPTAAPDPSGSVTQARGTAVSAPPTSPTPAISSAPEEATGRHASHPSAAASAPRPRLVGP